MKPLFYAAGPDIRSNHTTPPFLSVDIYPLLCSLLEIDPAPNNGSLERVRNFVAKQGSAEGLSNECRLLFPCHILSVLTVLVCFYISRKL